MNINILDQSFLKAVDIVNNLKKKPNDNELLKLYGLFKQANQGNNNSPEPGYLDIKGQRKWTSWRSNIGKNQEQAKQEYIKFAMELFPKYNN